MPPSVIGRVARQPFGQQGAGIVGSEFIALGVPRPVQDAVDRVEQHSLVFGVGDQLSQTSYRRVSRSMSRRRAACRACGLAPPCR